MLRNGEKDVSVFLLLFEGLGIYIALLCDTRQFISELNFLYTYLNMKVIMKIHTPFLNYCIWYK